VSGVSPAEAGFLVPLTLTLSGSGFVGAPTLACRVAGAPVPVTFVSTSTMRCAVPALPAAAYAVEIALDGQHWTASPQPLRLLRASGAPWLSGTDAPQSTT
jgi:hypothetical protein